PGRVRGARGGLADARRRTGKRRKHGRQHGHRRWRGRRALETFAGSWVGEEKIYPSPWDPSGGPANGRMESRIALDEFFLISDHTEERGGQVSYRGHGVYGWDPQDQCYTMHWVDGMGSIPNTWAKRRWEASILHL